VVFVGWQVTGFIQELPDGSHLRALGVFPGRRVYRVEGRRIEEYAPP
jgi:hypothetical protein